ncbi:MAG: PQQ-binding-like beta-propeller repeat protein [Verrucomicrobiota bacterium]
MRHFRFCPSGRLRALVLRAMILAPLLARADWPQILGPERNGLATQSPPLIETLDGDLPVLWKKKLGSGFAGPAVQGPLCLVFHREGNQAVVEALDRKTGKPRWAFRYPTDYRDNFGFDNGPRSTPTIAAGKVFTYGAEGALHCLDFETGTKIWQRDLEADFESPQGFFGRSCGPLVMGDQVLISCGGKEKGAGANIISLKTTDGTTNWFLGEDEASYASPVSIVVKEKELAVFFTRDRLAVVDPANGKLVYEAPFRSTTHASVNAASPVIVAEGIFLTSCYDVGAGLWSAGRTGEDWKSIWKGERVLDAHYATPIHLEGHLYGWHGRQERGQEFRCVDLKARKVRWQTDDFSAGTVVATKDRLLLLTEKGELVGAKVDASAFTPLFRTQILGAETRSFPALSEGVLFARDKKQIVAIDLRKKP